jgi:hypothetical protein
MPPDETLRDKTIRLRPGRGGRTLVRLDQPFDPAARGKAGTGAESGAPPAPECGGLFDRLHKAIFAARSDRRRMVRHEVVDHNVWVGWWSGDRFGAVPGRVVNLSRSGALAVLAHRPRRRQPVWVYKEVEATLAFVRGEVVAVNPAPGGEFSVRFRFASPCPTVLCQAVICGDGYGLGQT